MVNSRYVGSRNAYHSTKGPACLVGRQPRAKQQVNDDGEGERHISPGLAQRGKPDLRLEVLHNQGEHDAPRPATGGGHPQRHRLVLLPVQADDRHGGHVQDAHAQACAQALREEGLPVRRRQARHEGPEAE